MNALSPLIISPQQNAVTIASSSAPTLAQSQPVPHTIAANPELPDAVRLASGLTVIHKALPTPVITVDVWLPAGAMVEPPGFEGAAHFLEHLIFKGTERLAPGDFDLLVEASGGLTNAATSYDYVHYYCCASEEQLPQLLAGLAELLLAAAIPDQEFERERQVVLEEIRQYEDDPDQVAAAALWASVYGNHPYGRPILGWVESLEAQSSESLRQFHRSHYRPEQMTLVIAGGIERDRALQLAERCFVTAASPAQSAALLSDNWLASPPSDSLPIALPSTATSSPLPPLIATDLGGITHQSLVLPNVEQPRLMLAWPGPGIDQSETAVGLELLAVILCGGRSARLVQDLREQRRWVQGIDCDYSLLRQGGLFTLTAWLDEAYLTQTEARISYHLRELASTPVSQAELERAQCLLSNDFAFSLETSEQWADLLGYYQTVGTLPLALSYPQQVHQWTAEGLRSLAQRYLTAEHYTAMVLRPEASPSFAP